MKILCATIGSESCKRAEDLAIKKAKDNRADLKFVYVVDDTFLDGIPRRLHGIDDLDSSLAHIGELIVKAAQKKAKEQGVDSGTELRKGWVWRELEKIIREEKIDFLVLGNDKRSWINKLIIKGEVIDFVEDIKEKTGVDVIVVD